MASLSLSNSNASLTRNIAGCFLFLTLTRLFDGLGRVGSIDPLADNTFQLKLAGVIEDHRAVAL